jgi:hypothetical protein
LSTAALLDRALPPPSGTGPKRTQSAESRMSPSQDREPAIFLCSACPLFHKRELIDTLENSIRDAYDALNDTREDLAELAISGWRTFLLNRSTMIAA